MSIVIRNESGVSGLGLSALAGFGRRVLAVSGRRGWEVSVVLVGDPEIRSLNRRWRRLDRATDVLSFPCGPSPGPGKVLGDVVISVPRAEAQSRRFRVTLARELQRLLVHGILHLMGYDHKTAPERREMRALEERLLAPARPSAKRARARRAR